MLQDYQVSNALLRKNNPHNDSLFHPWEMKKAKSSTTLQLESSVWRSFRGFLDTAVKFTASGCFRLVTAGWGQQGACWKWTLPNVLDLSEVTPRRNECKGRRCAFSSSWPGMSFHSSGNIHRSGSHCSLSIRWTHKWHMKKTERVIQAQQIVWKANIKIQLCFPGFMKACSQFTEPFNF